MGQKLTENQRAKHANYSIFEKKQILGEFLCLNTTPEFLSNEKDERFNMRALVLLFGT